jgi:hypothetical protein
MQFVAGKCGERDDVGEVSESVLGLGGRILNAMFDRGLFHWRESEPRHR